MTIVNTKGMAFFGPGSEWFWAALQFTALLVTFVAIYRQLRITGSQRAVDQVEGYRREWNGERMNRHKLAVLEAVRDKRETPYADGLVLANYFDDLAMLAKSRHLDITLLWNYLGLDSEIWWVVLASEVQRGRAEFGVEVESDWVWLNRQFVRMDRRAGGVATIDQEFVATYLAGGVIDRLQARIRVEEALRSVIVASPNSTDPVHSAGPVRAPVPPPRPAAEQQSEEQSR